MIAGLKSVCDESLMPWKEVKIPGPKNATTASARLAKTIATST